MRQVYSAIAVVYTLILSSVVLGQAPPQGLSITNYLLVSQQPTTSTQVLATYRADLVNTGQALNFVAATVVSSTPNVQVVAGKDTLHFSPVPAHTQVNSSDTFTILVDRTVPFDFSSLQWTFQLAPPPIANAGPNQGAQLGQTVTLNGSASSNPSGTGTLTYSWAFTSRPPGSTAVLNNPASVMPTFLPDVAGDYTITLTVSNGVASASASTTVSTTKPPAPVANAGPSQTVPLGGTVVLNGSSSTSGSGNALTYSWTLLTVPAGSTATLTSPNAVSPAFVADKAGKYVAQLIVNDGLANSAPSTVTISTQPVKPVANAGPSQVVKPNSTVQLDGSGSTDVNGLPLTYQWSFVSLPAGSAALISDPTSVKPAFIADRPGTYVAQLIVSNGVLNSDPSTVMISNLSGPPPPIANAGVNQTVQQGATVQLNGSGTDPQGLPLTFQWGFASKPANSTATLSSTMVPNPTFVADQQGTYVPQLVVNNGFGDSVPATVTISTTCASPTANAGQNQNVGAGTTVTLDGTGSVGACNGPLVYSWSLTTRPNGSTATLSGINSASPTFVADVLGTYVAQLIVNNGFVNSNPATVTIVAAENAIILPSNVAVPLGQTAPFQVSLSKPAPAGGVIIALTSSDPSKAAVIPANVLIPEGQTSSSQPKLNGISLGSTTITAAAFGFTSATTTAQVSSALLTFIPSKLSINSGDSQNLTLAITPSSPTALTINLSSSDPTVASVPATVLIPANASSVIVPVTGMKNGSAVIHAGGMNLGDATATVTVLATAQIIVPGTLTLDSGKAVVLPITLSAPAPTGLVLTLSSSDTSKAVVTGSVVVLQGQTTPTVTAQVVGVAPGSATVKVSGTGYLTGTTQVQVNQTLTFFPLDSLSLKSGSSGTLSLTLAAPVTPPADLVLMLTSSDPAIAQVPTSVTIPAGQKTATIPVTALTPGFATITATAGSLTGIARVFVDFPCSDCIQVNRVSVGQNLRAQLAITLPNAAPSDGVSVTVTSSDPSKVLLGAVSKPEAVVTINPGSTTGFLFVQGLASAGTVTLTASAKGYTTGAGQVTLTPSAFVLSGPNGMGQPFSIGLGDDTDITVSAARLDASLKFAEFQPVGNSSPVVVNLSSSTPSVGTITPSVTFTGGDTTQHATFQSLNTGSTTLAASVPPGFSIPAQGANTLVATVSTRTLAPANVTVGQGLEATASISFNGNTTDLTPLTLTSSDPSKVLLSATPSGIGSASITLQVPVGANHSQDFYVYGLDKSGTVQYTATAPGFNTGTGTVTLGHSGFIITGPGGLGSVSFVSGLNLGDSPITVNSALLDQMDNYLATQAVAGKGSAMVSVTSFNTSVGTITSSPVTIAGGSSSGLTFFHPLNFGTSVLTVNTPAGYSTPVQFTAITANVAAPSVFLADGLTIGQNLEVPGFVGLPAPALSDTTITLTSNNPAQLRLSKNATDPGTASITVTIPAGQNIGQFYLQGFAKSGTATYTASAPGFINRAASVSFGPSGVVISGTVGAFGSSVSLAAGPSPLTVSVGLVASEFFFQTPQQLAGGAAPIVVSLTNSNPAVGTVPAQATIMPGNATVDVLFTPLKVGATDISVNTPPGYNALLRDTDIFVSVLP